MNPTHRKPVHGDPELARGHNHGRKGKADPSAEGPAFVVRDRRAEALLPTEMARPAPKLPGIKVIEKRASAGVEDPTGEPHAAAPAPVPAPSSAPAISHAERAAHATLTGSPGPVRIAPAVPDPSAPAPATSAPVEADPWPASSGAVPPTVREAQPARQAEEQVPAQAEEPKKRWFERLLKFEDYLTDKTFKKAKAATPIAAAGTLLYQVVDNFIDWTGERKAGDAIIGVVTDITSGFWSGIKWLGDKISSSTGWALGAAIGVGVVWAHSNVRKFLKSLTNIIQSEKARYYKVWETIDASLSLAFKLTKTAFASFLIYHLPSLVANGSEIVKTQKGEGFLNNVKHFIDEFASNAPLATHALFALAGVGVAWIIASAVRKLTDAAQEKKEQAQADAERKALVEARLAEINEQEIQALAAARLDQMAGNKAAEELARRPQASAAKPPEGSVPTSA